MKRLGEKRHFEVKNHTKKVQKNSEWVEGDANKTVDKRRNRCIWGSVRFECFSIIQLNDFFNYSRTNCVRTTSDRTLQSSISRKMFKLILGSALFFLFLGWVFDLKSPEVIFGWPKSNPKIWNESYKHFLGGAHVKYHWNGSKSSPTKILLPSYLILNELLWCFYLLFDVTQINMCKYIVLNLKVSSLPTYILKIFYDALTFRLWFGHIKAT